MPDPYADLRRGRACPTRMPISVGVGHARPVCRSPQGATIFRSTHGGLAEKEGQPLQDSEVDSLLFLAQQSQCVSGY